MLFVIRALTAFVLVFLPFSLGAEKAEKRAILATNIKSIAESDDKEASILEKISSYSLGWINGELDKTEEKIKSNTNFTHFGINIGVDTLGLKSEYSPYMELMSVYRLLEKSNVFLFNQTSLSNFEGRNTINTGFGGRYIFDDDKAILGINSFYDVELEAQHQRYGYGAEFLTSLLEFRTNYYEGISGMKTVNGLEEGPLDGSDFKVTGNLPYLKGASIYLENSYWTDKANYSFKTEEFGISAEVLDNLSLTIAEQKKDKKNPNTVVSLNYSIALGQKSKAPEEKENKNNLWNFKSVRNELYKPVERENKIVKKQIKLGVTVSGY